jgi:predicted ribosomally synthesized peptide with SipW-like signal peptide
MTLLTGGTWAFLSDTDLSPANKFTSGMLYLETSTNGGTTYTDGTTGYINVTNFKPTNLIPRLNVADFTLQNKGNLAASYLAADFSYTPLAGTSAATADKIAKCLEATTLVWNRKSLKVSGSHIPFGPVTNYNENSWVDLHDLTAQSGPGLPLAKLLPGLVFPSSADFVLQFTVQSQANVPDIDDYQGYGILIAIKFSIVRQ